MPSIEISNKTFEKLKKLMRPDETSELVIKRLLGMYEQEKSAPPSETEKNSFMENRREAQTKYGDSPHKKDDLYSDKIFGIGNLPHDLRHTKVLKASINGQNKSNLKWNKIIQCLLIMIDNNKLAYLPEGDFRDIRMRNGKHDEKGYHYIPEIGKSVQGVSASIAAKIIVDLANQYGISVDIFFSWRDKKEVYEGQRGTIARILVE